MLLKFMASWLLRRLWGVILCPSSKLACCPLHWGYLTWYFVNGTYHHWMWLFETVSMVWPTFLCAHDVWLWILLVPQCRWTLVLCLGTQCSQVGYWTPSLLFDVRYFNCVLLSMLHVEFFAAKSRTCKKNFFPRCTSLVKAKTANHDRCALETYQEPYNSGSMAWLYSQRFNRRVTRAQPEQASWGDLPLYSSLPPSAAAAWTFHTKVPRAAGGAACVQLEASHPICLPACPSWGSAQGRGKHTRLSWNALTAFMRLS